MNNIESNHKKFRWTFIGYNQQNEVVFPESVFKIKVDIPSWSQDSRQKMYIIQYIMHDSLEEPRQQFAERINSLPQITSATMNLYNGCGTLLETWELKDITMLVKEKNESCDGVIVEWEIIYKEIILKNPIYKS
jgi:hypothetical protein